jgi:hypothetical protein
MTFEFRTTVLPNGQIAVPSEIAGQIPAGTQLHVVLECEAAAAAASSYHALGAKLRETAYAPEETAYDSLA